MSLGNGIAIILAWTLSSIEVVGFQSNLWDFFFIYIDYLVKNKPPMNRSWYPDRISNIAIQAFITMLTLLSCFSWVHFFFVFWISKSQSYNSVRLIHLFFLSAFSTALSCFWLECTGYLIHLSWGAFLHFSSFYSILDAYELVFYRLDCVGRRNQAIFMPWKS